MKNTGWRILSTTLVTRAFLLPGLLSFAFSPAFFISCTLSEVPQSVEKQVTTELTLVCSGPAEESKAQSWSLLKRADIFVFKESGDLDTYLRYDVWRGGTLKVASGTGRRRVVVIANSRLTEEQVHGIGTYEDIMALENDFSSDSPEYPLMSGETVFNAGESSSASLTLTPVMSQIYIPSLTTKFSGKYAGKKLTDVKVYLVDINSRAGVMQDDGFKPLGIMNQGGLVEKDLQTLDYSGIVYSYLGSGKAKSGGVYSYSPASLYCYPNQSQEESAGSPFTRLVVEGNLDGVTNYYTAQINREGFGYSTGTPGIGRNVRYSVDIQITGSGAASIDGPAIDDGEDDGSGSEISQGSFTLHPGNIVTGRDGESVRIWCEVSPESTEVIFDEDDLDYDSGRGIYDYKLDADGRGVTLDLLKSGTGMFGIDIGEPVCEGVLVIVVVNP